MAYNDASRAATYMTSEKPLFQSRNKPMRYLRSSNAPRAAAVSSPIASPGSRIPTRKPFSTRGRMSLTAAFERASLEDDIEEERLRATGSSPSPAPRPRAQVADTRNDNVDKWRRETMMSTRGTRSVPDRLDATYERQEYKRGGYSEGSTAGATVGVDCNTDEIHRKITQHRRDRARLTAATSNQSGLFTRTWGSRARPQTGWLARIMSPESLEENHGLRQKPSDDEPIDWTAAAADVPLPSFGEDLPKKELTPPHSRPSSLQRRNSSPRIWDAEQDFNAESILVSTSPLIKPRNTYMDADTDDLPEMKPLPPLEPLLDTLDRPFFEEFAEEVPKAISKEVFKKAPPMKTPVKIPSYDDDEDEELDKTRSVLRALSRILTAKSSSSSLSTVPKSETDPEERIVAEASLFELPDIKPDRTSFRTPSPSKPTTLPTPVVTGAYLKTPATQEPEPFEKLTSARIKKLLNPEPQAKKAAKARPLVINTAQTYTVREDLQNIKADWSPEGSQPIVGSERSGGSSPSAGEFSSASSSALLLVIKPEVQIEVKSMASVNAQEQAGHKELHPHLKSGSAVPSVAEPEVLAEDDSMASSKQELKSSSTSVSSEPAAEVESGSSTRERIRVIQKELKELKKASSPVVPQAVEPTVESESMASIQLRERAHRKELKTLQRLEKTLQSSLRNIHEAKRGIENLEDQVSTAPIAPSASSQSSSAFIFVTIPIPRLWHSSALFDSPKSSQEYFYSSFWGKFRSFRPTFIGLLLFVFLFWLFAETAVCDVICHPKYSNGRGRQWQPYDPFWGFALPTLADRMSGGLLGWAWSVMVRIFGPILWPPCCVLLEYFLGVEFDDQGYLRRYYYA